MPAPKRRSECAHPHLPSHLGLSSHSAFDFRPGLVFFSPYLQFLPFTPFQLRFFPRTRCLFIVSIIFIFHAIKASIRTSDSSSFRSIFNRYLLHHATLNFSSTTRPLFTLSSIITFHTIQASIFHLKLVPLFPISSISTLHIIQASIFRPDSSSYSLYLQFLALTPTRLYLRFVPFTPPPAPSSRTNRDVEPV